MNRKSFGSGIDALFAETAPNSAEDPSSTSASVNEKVVAEKKGQSLKKKDTPPTFRTTVDLPVEQYEQVKALAYWDRMKMRDFIQEAIEAHINSKSKEYVEEALDSFRKSC